MRSGPSSSIAPSAAKRKRAARGNREQRRSQAVSQPQVVPITGSTGKRHPSEVYVTFRRKQSKAMADQLTTVSKKRLSNKVGALSVGDMERVNQAIATQLGL